MSKVSLQERYNKFSKAAKYNLNSEELFCVCRRVDDGELMVACDGCDEWFHFSCMKLDPKYKDLVSNFYCIFCDELLHKGSTLWKKKCRLDGCYKPVRVDADSQKASKYCSDEHGVEFMRTELLKRFSESSKECRLRVPEIASVVCGVADLDEFRVLGDSMPAYEGMDVDMPEELAQLPAEAAGEDSPGERGAGRDGARAGEKRQKAQDRRVRLRRDAGADRRAVARVRGERGVPKNAAAGVLGRSGCDAGTGAGGVPRAAAVCRAVHGGPQEVCAAPDVVQHPVRHGDVEIERGAI
ncbi:hypothetical protein KL908_002170 [Ogataea polymorpha]|nr:hypothetical protein KL908_002170 [Ogataea polymorpha]